MGTEQLTRREKEKLRQREDMLNAAMDLFSEHGYHNVSIQQIAERAEFAIGTLYKFFKNKEDLYNSLIRRLSEQSHNQIGAAMDQTDNETEKLAAFVRAKGRIFTDNAPMIRLYAAETRGASFAIATGRDSVILDQHRKMLDKLAAEFESGMLKGTFRRIADPYYLAVSLENITLSFLFLWLEDPDRHPYPDDPQQILDILFKGLTKPSS